MVPSFSGAGFCLGNPGTYPRNSTQHPTLGSHQTHALSLLELPCYRKHSSEFSCADNFANLFGRANPRLLAPSKARRSRRIPDHFSPPFKGKIHCDLPRATSCLGPGDHRFSVPNQSVGVELRSHGSGSGRTPMKAVIRTK